MIKGITMIIPISRGDWISAVRAPGRIIADRLPKKKKRKEHNLEKMCQGRGDLEYSAMKLVLWDWM